MTIEQILIVMFGLPTVTLLTGIFFRMGKLEESNISLKADNKTIWLEINRIKEKLA
ncbi:hypothetical protein [Kordiimonas sp.]|uniref:hypothetical protein n=1 Tax=Kordiimonas sp. TaxID=1970157 RepID=UPI003A957D18